MREALLFTHPASTSHSPPSPYTLSLHLWVSSSLPVNPPPPPPPPLPTTECLQVLPKSLRQETHVGPHKVHAELLVLFCDPRQPSGCLGNNTQSHSCIQSEWEQKKPHSHLSTLHTAFHYHTNVQSVHSRFLLLFLLVPCSLCSMLSWRTSPPSSWVWGCSVSGVGCSDSSATLTHTT